MLHFGEMINDEESWHYSFEGNDSGISDTEFNQETVLYLSEDGMKELTKSYPNLKDFKTAIVYKNLDGSILSVWGMMTYDPKDNTIVHLVHHNRP